jgi:GTP cyclohydrolase I
MEHDNEDARAAVGQRAEALALEQAAWKLTEAYHILGLNVPAETPMRVARWLADYAELEPDHEIIHDEWVVTFESDHREMVVTESMSFIALCEHHLLPFRGKAAIGYIPEGGRLLGLSKFARLLQVPCARPTLQENITSQIADAIMDKLKPLGCAVLLYDVEHTCMTSRGIRSEHARTTTSAVRGVFLSNELNSRDEFLQIVLARRG